MISLTFHSFSQTLTFSNSYVLILNHNTTCIIVGPQAPQLLSAAQESGPEFLEYSSLFFCLPMNVFVTNVKLGWNTNLGERHAIGVGRLADYQRISIFQKTLI